ncbi:MAG: hypothetical protein ABIU85_05825, partial [Methylotenera sp.]
MTNMHPTKAFIKKISYASIVSTCLIASAVSLNGCANNQSAIKEVVSTNNTKTQPVDTAELSADFVYKYLVAEIAG